MSEFRFVLDNDTSLIPPLVDRIQEQCRSFRIYDDQQAIRVSVALHEALTNAIHHGNLELDTELRQAGEEPYRSLCHERRSQPRYANRRVFVQVVADRYAVRFVVRDEGPGFDPVRVADPTLNLERIGGRGLLLIHSFMDEVFHNAAGNEITMIKRRTASNGSAALQLSAGAA